MIKAPTHGSSLVDIGIETALSFIGKVSDE
jgi:hypothetical protein